MKNDDWHERHKLPQAPTLEQRVKFHMEHARRCACGWRDDAILEELKLRYGGKHQDFWILHNTYDHRLLGAWAADCAERLLPYFETPYPGDNRPRAAIETLREWADTGIFSMSVIRASSLAAHSAAKDVSKKNILASYAAHAAGQAVGTAHVPTHSLGTVLYSIRLLAELGSSHAREIVEQELDWQIRRLPENLRPWLKSWTLRSYPLLPIKTRERICPA